MQAVSEDLLVVFSDSARIVFQIFIWPVVIIGFVGNLGVICRIFFADKNKNSMLKPFYRGALLSLAISDLLLLLTSGSNTLTVVGNNTVLWSLPEWCCHVLPYLQTVSVIVTSLTLAGVAIDRYAAIKSKYPLSNGSKWQWAVAFVMGIWMTSFAVSYPVLGAYAAEPLIVISNSTYYMATLCVTVSRVDQSIVFTALFAVIFVPLGAVFILVHVLLARNIWQRNCPGENVAQAASNSSQFSNENSTVSTSLGKPRPVETKKIGPTPSHVARKRRTVRAILVLIIVFVVCRLPHWSFLLYKIHATNVGHHGWYVQIIITSLSFVNAALHPVLYAFLNEALSLASWFRALCTKNRQSTIPIPIKPISQELAESTTTAKVPRGPYRSS